MALRAAHPYPLRLLALALVTVMACDVGFGLQAQAATASASPKSHRWGRLKPAQPRPVMVAAPQQLILNSGAAARVSLSRAAGSVVLGNPDIADVAVVGPSTLVFTAKGTGLSDVIVTDRNGYELWHGQVLVNSGSVLNRDGQVSMVSGNRTRSFVCTPQCGEMTAAKSDTAASAGGMDPAMATGPARQAAGMAAGPVGNAAQAMNSVVGSAQ